MFWDQNHQHQVRMGLSVLSMCVKENMFKRSDLSIFPNTKLHGIGSQCDKFDEH